MSISFDYFSISLLIGGFTALLSGFIVFTRNRTKLENIAWLLSNMTSAIWSFAYFATITALAHEAAIISDWILHGAAVFIPVCFLLSVLSITGEYSNHKLQLLTTAIIGFIFLLLIPSELFIRDVIPKAHFNFVPDAGPLYIYFTTFFFSVVFYTLYILSRKFRKTTDQVERNRLKYMIIFTILGFGGGGSVFFLTFNVPILPYPLVLFSIYPAVSGYAIFRYQLFDVKVITTEILVFLLWIFLLVRTLLSNNSTDALINSFLLLLTIFAGILLIRSVVKEVRQREEIEKLAEGLKNANQEQGNLMHFMNHQVKGRLGNAKNIFAELMTDDYGVMPEFAKPLLQKGLEEMDLGVNYVQNILRGSSAEKGTLPFDMKELDLRKIIEDVFGKQKAFAEKKGLTTELNIENGDYKIKGDMLQLSEAIRNLMDNSINYTQSGGLRISLKNFGQNIRFEIKDTGVGLTEDDKEKLFKSGGRGVESLKVNINATGYGLVFVKGVIEAHRGHVWAESLGRDKGSTFIFEIPR